MESTLNQKVAEILPLLEETMRRDDFAGWDPFDALNSRLFNATPLAKIRVFRLPWLQFFKRSPINFRGLTRTPKTTNSKTIGLMLHSYVLLNRRQMAAKLQEKLLSMRVSNVEMWGAAAWGYPFAWQAKAFYVPEGVPNVVCTAYALRGLEANNAASASLCMEAARFVERHLVRKTTDGKTYLAYVPGSDAMVHNASLWAAWILLKGWRAGGEGRWREIAQAAIAYTLSAQAEDGSWPYGEAPHHQFIDSFHTGYNLEVLHRVRGILSVLGDAMEGSDDAIARGMAYYQRSFFGEDGTPYYYANQAGPIDCHNAAQAMVTLLTIAPDQEKTALAGRVLRWTIEQMWNNKKLYFTYQKKRYFRNNINYIRWTQAWMFHALALWQSGNKK